MRVGIRVDASSEIGTGHLRRCMSLATALIDKGAEVRFVVRPHDALTAVTFESHPFPLVRLSAPKSRYRPAPGPSEPPHRNWAGIDQATDAAETVEALRDFRPEWVIVDHYAFDARWHEQVRQGLDCRIMAVDDLADRPLAVDVLLDANLADDHERKYAGRLKRRTRILGGPRFAVLGDAYRSAAAYRFNPTVRSLGVFMGGGDPDGVSARVLQACRKAAGFEGRIEVVSTSANPHLPALRQACDAHGADLTLDLPDLAAFYARHDLQIGGGGTASWERCRIGAPSIAMVLAPNQLAVIPMLARTGSVRVAQLSEAGSLDAPELAGVLRDLIDDPDARQSLSERGKALVDGRGAERVALCLLSSCLQIRPATIDDGARLHAWRDHPDTRAVSGDSAPIPLGAHMSWLARKLADDACRIYIAGIGETPVGSLRFDRQSNGAHEVSLYLNPDLTGLGLGPPMLRAGERALMAETPGDLEFTAAVVPDNTISGRLFVGAGYSGGPLRYNKRVAKQKSEP